MSNDDMGLLDIYDVKPSSWVVDFKVPVDIRDISLQDIRDVLNTAYYHCEDDEATTTDYYLYLNPTEKQQLFDEICELIMRFVFARYTDKPTNLFVNNSYVYMTSPEVVASVLYLIYGAQHKALTDKFHAVLVDDSTLYTWKNQQVVYLLAGPLSKTLLSHWFNLNKIKYLLPFEQTRPVGENADKEDKQDHSMEEIAAIYNSYMGEFGPGLGIA